ncbi:MAG: minor capsid protein [Bacteroidales bacterium]|nr:minor capsid protein [Bacteroidales bacterium]
MNEYWRQREEQAQREYELTEEQYVAELNSIYDYMLDQVKKEINGFYSKYASQEGITMAEAQQRTSQLDIEEYERKAQKYVEEKDFSAQANSEMRLYNLTMRVNRLQLLEANIGLETVSGFDELNEKLGEDLSERAVQEMRRQAGILGKTVQDNAKKANSIVGASFHNAKFSDRIWMYQAQLRDELDSLLRNGLIQGWNPNEMARHIDKLFDTGKYNCERLLRTELTRVQSDAQLESFTANGFNEYQFNALGDACRICAALDEKHFKISEAMPGENLPPIHPNCRCAVSAWMDDALYQQWLDSYANHGMSFEDWLNNRPDTAVEPGTEPKEESPKLEWTPASTLDEARNYARDVLGLTSTMDYSKMSLDYANMLNREISELYNTFGDMNAAGYLNGVRKLSLNSDTAAAYSLITNEMVFKSASKSAITSMAKEAKEEYAMGCWSTSAQEHVIRHELGHAVEQMIKSDSDKMSEISSLRESLSQTCNVSEWSVADAVKNSKTAGEYLSYYGLRNDGEFIAESIAEYMNGEARETAQAVVDIILR